MPPLRDADVRQALHKTVLRQHQRAPETVVLDEMVVADGLARVDIAVLNGELHGFEIKSDRDTLRRLPRQMEAYGRVFDRVTLVVGAAHLEEAGALVPAWWGLKTALGGPLGAVRFATVRPPQLNQGVKLAAVADLLWRDEGLALLAQLDAARGFRSKSRYAIADRLAEIVEPARLRSLVREQLKARHRAGWRSQPSPTSGGDSSRSRAMS